MGTQMNSSDQSRNLTTKTMGNPLLTDFYQFTMAFSYFKLGMSDQDAIQGR